MTKRAAIDPDPVAIARVLENERALNSMRRIAVRDAPLEQLLHEGLGIRLGVSWLLLLPKPGIFFVESGKAELKLVAQRGLAPELLTLCARVAFGHCLSGREAQTGQLQSASCVDDRLKTRLSGMAPHGHFNVPSVHGGKVLGVIVLYLPEGHPARSEEAFLLAVAEVLALVIHNWRIRDQFERVCWERAELARSDVLTGLDNCRHGFAALEREWATAERADRAFGLVLGDVDPFKHVNDRFGHPWGRGRAPGSGRAPAPEVKALRDCGTPRRRGVRPAAPRHGARSGSR